MKTWLTAALAALAIGCGAPPSELEACKHYCDKQGSCTNASSSTVADCKAGCDAMKTQFADADQFIADHCKNPGEVRQAIYDCYGNYCDTNAATQCATDKGQSICVAK